MADHYCSNLTFVLRNQVREQRSNTKADKNLQKQAKKAAPKPFIFDTAPLERDGVPKPSNYDLKPSKKDSVQPFNS